MKIGTERRIHPYVHERPVPRQGLPLREMFGRLAGFLRTQGDSNNKNSPYYNWVDSTLARFRHVDRHLLILHASILLTQSRSLEDSESK